MTRNVKVAKGSCRSDSKELLRPLTDNELSLVAGSAKTKANADTVNVKESVFFSYGGLQWQYT
jgi:hypothetical protein